MPYSAYVACVSWSSPSTASRLTCAAHAFFHCSEGHYHSNYHDRQHSMTTSTISIHLPLPLPLRSTTSSSTTIISAKITKTFTPS